MGMEALINNNVVKNLGGRPRKYTRDELIKELTRYFENENNVPYSILEICAVLGVTRETLSEWESDDKYGLSDVVARAKHIVAAGWEKGRVHPKIGEFLLKNYMGMADRQEISISGTIIHQVVPASPAELQERLAAAQAAISRHAGAIVDGEVVEARTEPE